MWRSVYQSENLDTEHEVKVNSPRGSERTRVTTAAVATSTRAEAWTMRISLVNLRGLLEVKSMLTQWASKVKRTIKPR